jgi:hypothetical protein
MSELQIQEDTAFQYKLWLAERISWIITFIIVLASLAGLLGEGKAGQAVRGEPGELQIRFNRLIRFDNTTEIKVNLPPVENLSLELPRDYLSEVREFTIMPAPASVVCKRDEISYQFAPESELTELQLTCKPAHSGSLAGYVKSGEQKLNFTQFVFP